MSKIRESAQIVASQVELRAALQELQDDVFDIASIAIVVKQHSGLSKVVCTDMAESEMAWLRWVFDQDFRPTRYAIDPIQRAKDPKLYADHPST